LVGAVKPRALDLFCCAGGISEGLLRAGFDVVGVDIAPQPHYLRGPGSRGAQFVQADALAFLGEVLDGQHGAFDFIHASPPCQGYSSLRHLQKGKTYPQLIEPTRELLHRWGGLWSIENVPGAPLSGWLTVLCGTMFGLQTPDGRAELRRHRLFETSFSIPLRPACQHGHVGIRVCCVVGEHPHSPAARSNRPAVQRAADRRKVLTVTGHTPVDNTARLAGKGRREQERVIHLRGGRQGHVRRDERAPGKPGRSPPHRARETFSVDDARAAMGIDWMPMAKLSQAIPPAYAEWIGRQALQIIGGG
jgi:DNA (cytosine-5)-methyltransferase 1